MSDAIVSYNGRTAKFLDCDPDDCIQGHLLKGFWYESALLDVLAHLEAEGTYIDIGAYVGTFSVFAGLFTAAQEIIAIEPQPDIFRKLRANLVGNGITHCRTYNAALSDWTGLGNMTDDATNKGGSRLTKGGEIAVVTLDGLLLPRPTVVKIDVEASELAVLKGGMQTIAQADHLLIEYWPEATCQAYGIPYTGQEVADILQGMGFAYRCELPGDSHLWGKL